MVPMTQVADALQILNGRCEAHAMEHNILHSTSRLLCMVITPNNSRVKLYARSLPEWAPLRFVSILVFTYLGHMIPPNRTDYANIKRCPKNFTLVGNATVRIF